jgi:hypothetical protein
MVRHRDVPGKIATNDAAVGSHDFDDPGIDPQTRRDDVAFDQPKRQRAIFPEFGEIGFVKVDRIGR